MPSLFYLPKVVSLPDSKLYFFLTGTSTPQNVYTDEDLQVPHDSPVEADEAGVFAPIYLDPTLPAYRVSHFTAADVLIYTVDDVPSNQNVQQSMRLESTLPSLFWYDTDGTANKRKFRIIVSGDRLSIQSSNDAESVFTDCIQIRTDITNRAVIAEAATIDTGLVEYPVAYVVSDTFSGTLTGFATPPTGAISYAKVGNLITVRIPSAAEGFTGTSDATSMTITGMPTLIRPLTTQHVPFTGVVDSGNLIGDGEQVLVRIGSDGVITFLINGSATGFTPSGTKSTSLGGTFSYLSS